MYNIYLYIPIYTYILYIQICCAHIISRSLSLLYSLVLVIVRAFASVCFQVLLVDPELDNSARGALNHPQP